jgi:hypothetical protein
MVQTNVIDRLTISKFQAYKHIDRLILEKYED